MSDVYDEPRAAGAALLGHTGRSPGGEEMAGREGENPMSETMTLVRNIVLNVDRCWQCGHWWAAERVPATCPMCASRKVEEFRQARDRADRRAAALRGALTKAKRAGR